jgi:hypothetical protein
MNAFRDAMQQMDSSPWKESGGERGIARGCAARPVATLGTDFAQTRCVVLRRRCRGGSSNPLV